MNENKDYLVKRNLELKNKIGNLTKELPESRKETLTIKQVYEDLKIDMLKKDYESNKLASLEHLIAGIAHEINNPNTYIRANIELLQKYWKVLQKNIVVGEDSTIKNIINDIPNVMDSMYKGTGRIAEIIETVKHFSREDKFFTDTVNLNQCIEEAYKLVKIEFAKEQVNFVNNVCEKCSAIYGSRQQIEQVLVNLFLNSINAIRAKKFDKGSVIVDLIEDNEFVTLHIKDNGCGIKEENLDKIFNPFFTTRAEDGGTGLGLSIVHDIIKVHRGSIEVNSNLDEGTDFALIFPKVR